MWLINNDVAISCLPKVGSTSLGRIMENKTSHPNEDVLYLVRRIAVIRHPISRLKSAFAFHRRCKERGISISGRKDFPVDSWEDFIDWTFTEDLIYWCKQKYQLSYQGEYLATETYKLENLTSEWKEISTGQLPWINRCNHLPTNDYRNDELQDKYKEDLELWSGL